VAAVFAREAAANANDFNNAHASIVAKHRKMFLQCAFGIKPDGTVITDFASLSEKLKKYKSFKTYDKYNNMIHVISNWGDNAILNEAFFDDPEATAIRKFCKNKIRGYYQGFRD